MVWFKDTLHITFEDGLFKVAKGIFDTVEAKFIKTDRIEAAAGVTVFDRTTGDPYCMGVDQGITVSTPGACGEATSAQENPESSVEPSSEASPSATPEPEVSTEPTPEPTAEVAPEPTPESEPAPTPEPSPEPTTE